MVTDETNQPLPGVNILVKEQTTVQHQTPMEILRLTSMVKAMFLFQFYRIYVPGSSGQ